MSVQEGSPFVIPKQIKNSFATYQAVAVRVFCFQFCDVAQVALVHKTILSDLAVRKWKLKKIKLDSFFCIFGYLLQFRIENQ
jgi:hypothetical protein